jgi:cystathionine gamma-synthase/methionine-gamma-lyase
MTDIHQKAFSTRAVHAGERTPPGDFVPVATPIHASVGYLYDGMDQVDAVFAGTHPGYVYARYGGPTLTALESALANLEGAEAAHAFSSGMAALHASLLAAGARAGEAVVAAFDLYGATFMLLRGLLSELGVSVFVLDVGDLDAVESALKNHRPVALLAETISNPLLKVADIPSLSELAKRYGAKLLVDNTFATPYLFNPLAHGADFAIHSATKYLSGHGDVLAGIVACSITDRQKLFELNKLIGSVLGPYEAWLVLRGLKTLPLRVRQQFENASRIAGWLRERPGIAHVYYPGLPEHPGHALAGRMFEGKGCGGVLSFEIKLAGREDRPIIPGETNPRDLAYRFMDSLRLWLPATTLGDIYSLALHPATASHRGLSAAERAEIGISDNLVRLSAGIEAVDDLIADLDQALEKTLASALG